MNVETTILVVVATTISIGFSIFLAQRQSKAVHQTFVRLDTEVMTLLQDAQDQFNTILEPIIHTNSRVMGILGERSGEVRSIKAMDKAIGRDIMDQMPLELALIEEAFPNLAEKLKADPRLLQEAIPRIRALLGKEGMPGMDALGARARFKSRFPEE